MLTYELSGQPDEADASYEQGLPLYDSWEFGRSASVWIRLGRGVEVGVEDVAAEFVQFADPALEREEARSLLSGAAAHPDYASPVRRVSLAVWAAHHDDTPQALRLLEDATTAQPLLTYFLWLPVFDEVRQRSEFKDLLVKLGLPEYWDATSWPDVCRRLGRRDFTCD
jgi:hypothetical protein